MSDTKSQGSPLHFWAMVWPLFIDLLLYYAILFTDSFFLSRISDQAAASVGALFPVFGICVMLFNQMGTAGCSVASQYIGAKRNDRVMSSYAAAVAISGVIGLVIGAFMLVFSRSIGLWVGLSPFDNHYSTVYIAITGPALLLLSLKAAYVGIISSHGKTYWSMMGSICYNLTNIGLNIVFLRGMFGAPKLGVYGVAIATVVSQALLLGFLMWVVHFRMGVRLRFVTAKKELSLSRRQILRIGIPASLEPISVQMVQVFITSFIIFVGIQAMAAKTYVTNISLFILAWSIAVGVATQIMVARYVGAKQYERANRQMHFGMGVCVLGVLVLVGLVVGLSHSILGIFTDSREIVQLGTTLLLLGFLLEPLRAVNIVTQFSLVSAGDAKFTAITGAILMWAVGLPVCYLLGIHFGYGLVGIWAGIIVDEFVRAIVYYSRWRTRHWERTGVVADENDSPPRVGEAA